MPLQISSLLSSQLLKSKDSWAPAFYYFLQITLLTALVLACPYFIDFQNRLHFILFWTVTATTLVLYFITHRMDPGYIPHDAVFFTDQNETSQKPSPVAWKKFESIGSLRGPFSLPSTTDLASSILKSDRLGQKNSIVDIKKLSSAENGGTLANIVSLVSQPIQEVQENVDEKHEDTADHTFKLVIKELEANLSIQTVAECEASLEENDDATQHKIESLKHLDSKIKSSKDNVNSIDIERKSGDKLKPKNSGRNKSLLELPNQDKKTFIEIFHSVPTMHGDEDNKTKCEEIIGKYTNEEDCKTGMNILDRISSGNLSPQARNSMEEDSVKFCTLSRDVSSPRVEHHQLISAKDSHRDNTVIKPIPVQYQSRIFSNEDDQNVQGNKDTYRIGISSFDDDITLSARKKKDQIGLLDWSTSFRSPIIRKGIENMEASHIKEPGDGEALYVERRYCNICSLDQPFRSKHCRDCNRCVAQYDHHCPWLGTCVGEKNHLVFYFFLIFQVIEIAWADIKLFGQIIDSESWMSFSLILVVPLTLILIMVSALWIFHTYLASINLTTWESLSWEKISYLKDWRTEWGSPFSKGLIKNLKFFCCESKSQLQKWRLPKYKKAGK